MKPDGVKSKIGSLYSVFTPFLCLKLYIFELTFTFCDLLLYMDWMMQGWTCESHLWIILIGQSDIVKVFIFVSLPNEVFVHLVTHSIVGKSDFESGILFLGGIFSDFPEYFFEFSRVYFRNLLENFSGFWVFFHIFHLRIIEDIFLGLTSIFPDLRYYSEFHFSIFTDSKYFSKLSRSIFPDLSIFLDFSIEKWGPFFTSIFLDLEYFPEFI